MVEEQVYVVPKESIAFPYCPACKHLRHLPRPCPYVTAKCPCGWKK
ncbi:MAG TPA: hypothetical protein VEP90_18435 [Methylomirabilota bacterium]|nr:hypothetical protein [Methylomirabilota bacterium]